MTDAIRRCENRKATNVVFMQITSRVTISNDFQPFVKAGQLASIALEAVALSFRLYHEASREILTSSHLFIFFQSDEAEMESLHAHWVEGLPQTKTLGWIQGDLSGWNSAILWWGISYRKVFFEELEWDVGQHRNRRVGDEGWLNFYRDRTRDSKQWFFHGYVVSFYREDFKDWCDLLQLFTRLGSRNLSLEECLEHELTI